MSLTFPSNPQIDEIFFANKQVYRYTGSKWNVENRKTQEFGNDAISPITLLNPQITNVDSSVYNFYEIEYTTVSDKTINMPSNSVPGSKVTFLLKTSIFEQGVDNTVFSKSSINFDEQANSNAYSFFISPNGNKLYTIPEAGGFSSEEPVVYQYDLSTAWDISTASYSTISFDVFRTEGIFFKPDGTKMFIAGSISESVYEYDLSTAWDINTASYSTFIFLDVSGSYSTVSFDVFGSKMYYNDYINETIFQRSSSSINLLWSKNINFKTTVNSIQDLKKIQFITYDGIIWYEI